MNLRRKHSRWGANAKDFLGTAGLYTIRRLSTVRLRPLLKEQARPRRFLSGRGKRVVSAFGAHLQAGTCDSYFDIPIGAAWRSPRGVAQRVLVTSVAGSAGVCDFNVVAGQLGKDLAASGRGIL